MLRTHRRRTGALVALALGASLVLPAIPARAATTYDVQIGLDFFEGGVPGFSARFFPTSVTLHRGDTLHFFGFGPPGLFPAGQVPEEELERRAARIGDEFYFLHEDPDDGPNAFKLNPQFVTSPQLDCGTQDNPCTWDGNGDDVFSPPFMDEIYVTITANPGDVIYGISTDNSHFRIEVVPDGEEADTQAELNSRAERLMDLDQQTALALHNGYKNRVSKHKDARGRTVFDAWVGLDQGPISMLAMYPRKLSIKKGQRVQFHFPLLQEIHTASMPRDAARPVLRNGFQPVCDPDGDGGTQPDTPVEGFDDQGNPICPEGSTPEFDISRKLVEEQGNGVLKNNSDLESSGLKGAERLTEGSLNTQPWTVRFDRVSPDGGWVYFCLVHGQFQRAKIFVR